MEREKYPEAWIRKAVNIHGAPHAMGALRDVNEYGITYETVETVPRHCLTLFTHRSTTLRRA